MPAGQPATHMHTTVNNEKQEEGGGNVKATPLGVLPRPLGVRERPQWMPLSMEEKTRRLLDEDLRKERENALKKASGEAYYADFHKLSFHGGKRWIAPEQLIREDRSLYLPNLSGKTLGPSPTPTTVGMTPEERRAQFLAMGPNIPTLDGKAHTAQLALGNVSLVALVNSQISQEQIKAWTTQIAEKWRSHERFRFIHVNLQQNPLRTFVVSFFTSGLKKIIPRHLHQTYILSYDNVDYIREAIGLENKFVAHLYLVDWEGRIRWAGCGNPWNGDNTNSTAKHNLPIAEGGPSGQVAEGMVQGLGEVQRLERCLQVLMNRLDVLARAGKI